MNPEIFISNKAKEAVKALYGVEVEVCSLYEDRMRVCVPANIGQ